MPRPLVIAGRVAAVGRWSPPLAARGAAEPGRPGAPATPRDRLLPEPGDRPVGAGRRPRRQSRRPRRRRRRLPRRPRRPQLPAGRGRAGPDARRGGPPSSKPTRRWLVAERDGYSALDGDPNDPLFGQLWGLRNIGAGINGFAGAVAGADIDAPRPGIAPSARPATVVADIDTGYRFDDPDLGPVAWTNPGEIAGNGVDDDGNGIVDDLHGADFVGTNAERTDQRRRPDRRRPDLRRPRRPHRGDDRRRRQQRRRHHRRRPERPDHAAAGLRQQPAATKLAARPRSIIAAINYAGHKGARAANMSLGGNTSSQAEVNAIAANPQTLFVISAGNDGGNNDGGEAAQRHHYPCDYQPTSQAAPPVPGAIDNIVCVAATDQADGLAGFSDWGATSVDLGAPGPRSSAPTRPGNPARATTSRPTTSHQMDGRGSTAASRATRRGAADLVRDHRLARGDARRPTRSGPRTSAATGSPSRRATEPAALERTCVVSRGRQLHLRPCSVDGVDSSLPASANTAGSLDGLASARFRSPARRATR